MKIHLLGNTLGIFGASFVMGVMPYMFKYDGNLSFYHALGSGLVSLMFAFTCYYYLDKIEELEK